MTNSRISTAAYTVVPTQHYYGGDRIYTLTEYNKTLLCFGVPPSVAFKTLRG